MLRNEVQSSNQVSDVAIEDEGMVASDLLVNNLVYKAPAALSLAVDRTYVRMFPQNTSSGPGQTTVFDLTSGTAFVNPYNSYLKFDLAVSGTGTPEAHFGVGSSMNIVSQITIRSRSGTELARVEKANFYSYIKSVNQYSLEYLNNQGQVEGWNSSGSALVTATPRTFCIPLVRLAPFFEPTKRGQKYPCQLISGLHIEIIWESLNVAFMQQTATPTNYALTNIAIMLDSMTLTDDTQRAINLESAKNGLEVTVPQVFTSQDSITSASIYNAQLRKAVTQANRVILVPFVATPPALNVDCFKTMAGNISSFQFRLGSLYFPKQAITNLPECYLQMLMSFDKLRNELEPTAVSYNSYILDHYSLCASLEKDQSLQVSALPINNSRVLESLITFTTGQSANVYVFLEYVSVIRTFIDNASLSI